MHVDASGVLTKPGRPRQLPPGDDSMTGRTERVEKRNLAIAEVGREVESVVDGHGR